MQKAPPTPKGFRDISPEVAKKRNHVIRTITSVLEENKFEPLETPTLEFAETLTGKYGEDERLIYRFTDRGGRDLALRYDLTVPLARFVANNQNLLNPTFSRYQIGQVFRGENPQHGRYREFTQFDFDTVGPSGVEEDAKIIQTAMDCVKKIGLKDAKILINDRDNFKEISPDVIRALDKLHKIGQEGVIGELEEKGIDKNKAKEIVSEIKEKRPTESLEKIIDLLSQNGLIKDQDFAFDPTLARGLDYYTGTIFELKPNEKLESLTIGSGGRYDNLIGMFAGKQISAVGFSFGIDRIVDLLE